MKKLAAPSVPGASGWRRTCAGHDDGNVLWAERIEGERRILIVSVPCSDDNAGGTPESAEFLFHEFSGCLDQIGRRELCAR